MTNLDIQPWQPGSTSRTGTLVQVAADDITAVLGFPPNVDDDWDKVVHSWGFKLADGRVGAIWDYKGSHLVNRFSTWGPREMFEELFGDNYLRLPNMGAEADRPFFADETT